MSTVPRIEAMYAFVAQDGEGHECLFSAPTGYGKTRLCVCPEHELPEMRAEAALWLSTVPQPSPVSIVRFEERVNVLDWLPEEGLHDEFARWVGEERLHEPLRPLVRVEEIWVAIAVRDGQEQMPYALVEMEPRRGRRPLVCVHPIAGADPSRLWTFLQDPKVIDFYRGGIRLCSFPHRVTEATL